MNNYPIPGATYTLRRIDNELMLDDSPHLILVIKGRRAVIQNSHFAEHLGDLPVWESTAWRYIRTTHEWIPVFHAVDDAAVLELVDFVEYEDIVDGPTWWVTPKGFPREVPRA